MAKTVTRKTWALRIVLLGLIVVLSAIGFLNSPANATLTEPGRVISLTDNNMLQKPYTLNDTEGEWDVLTVRQSNISQLEKFVHSATHADGYITAHAAGTDEESDEVSGEAQAVAARQASLNAAMEAYTGTNFMLVVEDTDGTDLTKGSRVLSVNHEPPTAGLMPAGTWLVASPWGGVEVHEVERSDIRSIPAPIRAHNGSDPIPPGVDAVAAPVFQLGDVKGPSSGLGLALAWVDALTPENLTGGLHVAATGVVDRRGEVIPVGEVELKLLAAAEAGADLVLVPNDYEGPIPEGLHVERVDSVEHALEVVAAHR